MGLRAGPWTPQAREVIALLGTVLPFEQVPAILGKVSGLQVSASTVRAVTEAAGAALCLAVEAEWAHLQRELPDPVTLIETCQISVDGAMVSVVGEGWREVRTLAIGAVQRRPKGGIVTDQLSYLSRMLEADRFAELATVEVHRRGVERAPVVAAVADGAGWCQRFFDLQAPRAIRILDFPHAVQHLGSAAQAVFGESSAAAVAWLMEQRTALQEGDPTTVLAALAALPVETASHPDAAREVRDRELAYFQTRRDQITYAEFMAAGLPIGSGAVESANKLVVQARMKRSGMHWASRHVNPMLALHGAHCSQRWDEAWSALGAHLTTRLNPMPTPSPSPTPHAPPRAPTASPHDRPKTIVNGRPTADHPWKRGTPRPPSAPPTAPQP